MTHRFLPRFSTLSRGAFGSDKGHTLVELAIAIPTFLILALVMIQFMISSSEGIATISAEQTLQENLSRAMREVMTDVQMAEEAVPILQPPLSPITSCTANGHTYTASPTVLCLYLPGLDATGQPLQQTPHRAFVYDQIIYAFNPPGSPPLYGQLAGTLRRIVVPGTNGVITSSRPARDNTIVSSSIISGAVVNGLIGDAAGSGTSFTITTAYTAPNGRKDAACRLVEQQTERRHVFTQTLSSRAWLRNYRK